MFPHRRTAGSALVALLPQAMIVLLGLVAEGKAQDGPYSCDVKFTLANSAPIEAIQYVTDYGVTTGTFYGNGGSVAKCTALLPGVLTAYQEDEAGFTLRAGHVRLADFAAPLDLLSCRFATWTIPAPSDFAVTVEDAVPGTVAGNSTNVCGAPETGSSPPFARDALVVLRSAVGYDVTCDPCECDANNSGMITASDSLIVLRRAVGMPISPYCPPCEGAPVAAGGGSGSATIAVTLDCALCTDCGTCGDQNVDVFEQCDDGNTANGDCCSSTCQFEAEGSSCSDGNACTTGDVCNATGACLQGPTPLVCDDEDHCSQDTCDPHSGCVFETLPSTGCITGTNASFLLKNKDGDAGTAGDLVRWNLSGGGLLEQADLGDPVTSRSYALCVYDERVTVPTIVVSLPIHPSAFWVSTDPSGYKYSDRAGSSGGVVSARLKTGAEGKSAAKLVAKGTSLYVPPALTPTQFFAQDGRVIVQLINDETGLCWSSEFSTALRNDGVMFKARTP